MTHITISDELESWCTQREDLEHIDIFYDYVVNERTYYFGEHVM